MELRLYNNLHRQLETFQPLDPSRVTVYVGLTGIDGATFKRAQLMDKFGIQINKTSRNTVLFMTNIGTTRSSVAYLIEVLVSIARDIDNRTAEMNLAERAAFDARLQDQPQRDAQRSDQHEAEEAERSEQGRPRQAHAPHA